MNYYGDFMSIGERISKLRKQQNISQAQLAKALDVTRQAVSKWENDLTAPDTIKLIQLADVLDTDVEYLATGNHSALKSRPEIITIEKPVETVVEKVIEKVVEKPVVRVMEKPVVEYVERPVLKKVTRIRYVRNPIEFALTGIAGIVIGFLIGLLF